MSWPWGRSGEADGAQGGPERLFLGWQWARLSPLKASPPGLCGELLRGLCSPSGLAPGNSVPLSLGRFWAAQGPWPSGPRGLQPQHCPSGSWL